MFLKHEVVANKRLNSKFHLITFKANNPGFNFRPGQFVTLKVTNSVFRCYSIFSSPDILPSWEMFVDITPGGPGTTYLKNLKKGEIIETSPSTGTFIYENNGRENIIFAGTGCGIAPLLPILTTCLNNSKHTKTVLFWGLRYIKDIVLEERLKILKKSFPNFSYEIILSRPEKEWAGNTGHVQKQIFSALKEFSPNKTAIYLSGNGEFIKETLATIKKNKKSLACVYFEKCY